MVPVAPMRRMRMGDYREEAGQCEVEVSERGVCGGAGAGRGRGAAGIGRGDRSMARRSPAGNNRPTHNGSAAAVGLLICLAVGSLAQAQTAATSMARGRAAAREVRAASRAL